MIPIKIKNENVAPVIVCIQIWKEMFIDMLSLIIICMWLSPEIFHSALREQTGVNHEDVILMQNAYLLHVTHAPSMYRYVYV